MDVMEAMDAIEAIEAMPPSPACIGHSSGDCGLMLAMTKHDPTRPARIRCHR